jgi:hypothetical protein
VSGLGDSLGLNSDSDRLGEWQLIKLINDSDSDSDSDRLDE